MFTRCHPCLLLANGWKTEDSKRHRMIDYTVQLQRKWMYVCMSTCVSQSAVCVSVAPRLCAPKFFFSTYHDRITLDRCSYACSYFRVVRKYFLLMRTLEVITLYMFVVIIRREIFFNSNVHLFISAA